jgi:hypothetical protein
MEIKDAISIVFELASQNVIDEREAQLTGELFNERLRQEAALECVAAWARHALDVRL